MLIAIEALGSLSCLSILATKQEGRRGRQRPREAEEGLAYSAQCTHFLPWSWSRVMDSERVMVRVKRRLRIWVRDDRAAVTSSVKVGSEGAS